MVKRILLVDDDATNRAVGLRFLERAGHVCVAVENGQRAWELLDQGQRFDYLLSDYEMPEKNGIELLKLVFWNERMRSMHRILMSGRLETVDGKSTSLEAICREYEADFIVKPLDYDDFIERYLGGMTREMDDS